MKATTKKTKENRGKKREESWKVRLEHEDRQTDYKTDFKDKADL